VGGKSAIQRGSTKAQSDFSAAKPLAQPERETVPAKNSQYSTSAVLRTTKGTYFLQAARLKRRIKGYTYNQFPSLRGMRNGRIHALLLRAEKLFYSVLCDREK
jgi:hypothetical protein